MIDPVKNMTKIDEVYFEKNFFEHLPFSIHSFVFNFTFLTFVTLFHE